MFNEIQLVNRFVTIQISWQASTDETLIHYAALYAYTS